MSDSIKTIIFPLLDAGAEGNQEITSVGPGRRIASVKDFDGNVIGVLQDG